MEIACKIFLTSLLLFAITTSITQTKEKYENTIFCNVAATVRTLSAFSLFTSILGIIWLF